VGFGTVLGTVLSAAISRAQRLSHGFALNALGLYGQ